MSAYSWFEGIPFSTILFKKEIIEKIHKFVIRDEDTVILSFPKSGTNWLIETVCLIQTKGNPKWIQSVPIWDRSPWIETQRGYPQLINKEGPRLISSHLPFHLFPKSFFRSKAKLFIEILASKITNITDRVFPKGMRDIQVLTYHSSLLIRNFFGSPSTLEPVIYIIRNPRDVLVSGYFFHHNTNLTDNPESLGTYFECFLKGNVPYGSWFEHTRDWLSMRENDNFLLLSYEDMKKNTRGTIEKICDFLGKKLEPDELDLVIKYSSFQAMEENKMSNYSLIKKDEITNGLVLMRKGEETLIPKHVRICGGFVGPMRHIPKKLLGICQQSLLIIRNLSQNFQGVAGDWKNHFTVAHAETFDKVFQEKMAGFPPGLFAWE